MKAEPSMCYLRFFHGLPSTYCLDIYIDDQLIYKNILYEDFTAYKPVQDKEHLITLCYHHKTEVLFSEKLWLSSERIYTLCLFPLDISLSCQLLLLNEPAKLIPEEHLLARAVNLSLTPEPLKLRFAKIKPEFKKLDSGHFTSYLSFQPDVYHLELLTAESSKIKFQQSNLIFKPTRYYALYMIGGITDYPLKVVPAIEGNSMLQIDKKL